MQMHQYHSKQLKTYCPICFRPSMIYHLDFEATQCRGPKGETMENCDIVSPSNHYDDKEYEGCGNMIKKTDLLIRMGDVGT